MQSDARLPLLVLGLLTILAAGAVVLGLLQAPPTADLTVHNALGETTQASSLVYYVTATTAPGEVARIAYRSSPATATETLFTGGAHGRAVRRKTVTGPLARRDALQSLTKIESVTGFSPVGPAFVATQSASTLVSPAERHEVSGSLGYTATVRGGYLVGLVARFHIVTPDGTQTGTDRLRVTNVGGQPVSSL